MASATPSPPAAPLDWLLRTVVAAYDDTSVTVYLDEREESAARAVFPPSFFGWLSEQVQTHLDDVRALNDGNMLVPYADVGRSIARLVVEFSFRVAHNDGDRRLLDLDLRVAGPAARLGVDASLVVQSMRSVERGLVTQFLSSSGEHLTDIASSVLGVSASLFDPIVLRFVEDYVAEESRIRSEALASRRALVEALLVPGVHDASPFDALGVSLSSHHLGVVLWFTAGGVGAELEAAARRLRDRTQATTLLSVPGDERTLWVWLSWDSAPTIAPSDQVASLTPDSDRLRYAVGPLDHGIRGFRRTHLLARDYADAARRIRADDAPIVADAATVSFLSLLLRDRERADWFVSTELGTLGSGSSASDVESRETLRIYLETGQSLAETARRMRIHRNTVVYRIRRVEQAIGHPIAARRHELYAAALLARLLRPTD